MFGSRSKFGPVVTGLKPEMHYFYEFFGGFQILCFYEFYLLFLFLYACCWINFIH
jgi:hypothetical protein